MKNGKIVAAVIPALDEEQSIGAVVASLPDWLDRIVVVDNGSSDGTAQVASAAGADVVTEARRGYGAACLKGIAEVGPADVIVFIDADGSDDPDEMAGLVEPVAGGEADLVIGSRVLGGAEPKALGPVQRFGNRLSCCLVRALWNVRFTDLGPFRAIDRRALDRLAMSERAMGWTIEMQVKAVTQGCRVREVPVRYRRRMAGRSKISGSVTGSLRAGFRILYVIARVRFAGV